MYRIEERRSTIDRLAAEQGKTPEQFVKEILSNSTSAREAAKRIGISSTAFQFWLLKNGYEVVVSGSLVKRKFPTDIEVFNEDK